MALRQSFPSRQSDISMKVNIWKTIALGPLPVAAIDRCLGLALVAGEVVFFEHAQKHAFEKQLHRHPICMPHLADTVTDPTHVGQQPKHRGKGFDLVRVVPGGPIILIGIRLVPLKKSGVYTVSSTYPIDQDTLARRLRLGTTIVI
jgi:hypothetical protein